MDTLIEGLCGKLIVSCQAGVDEPLHGPAFMAAMARAAELGGAAGIRANGPADIAAIRAAVSLPIIGINKKRYPGCPVYITPSFADAREIVEAGAHIVALDGTSRPRPEGVSLAGLVARIRGELGVPVMADLSCLEDALAAQQAGVDLLATTLAGYTEHGRPPTPGPDFDLISQLVEHSRLPVIAEGRFVEPAQVAEAFARGAHAVVVGSAITRPQAITRRFVEATPARRPEPHTQV